jgi:aspartyl-tRNA(Asn)/glutamyl-tRNA(Gln) amidotransferase subunit C
MADVNESLTRQVAELARLELTASEVTTFTHQLGEILNYVEQLQKVDTQDVEPLTHPIPLQTQFRADQVISSPVNSEGKPKILDSAPEVLYEGFKVPPIM